MLLPSRKGSQEPLTHLWCVHTFCCNSETQGSRRCILDRLCHCAAGIHKSYNGTNLPFSTLTISIGYTAYSTELSLVHTEITHWHSGTVRGRLLGSHFLCRCLLASHNCVLSPDSSLLTLCPVSHRRGPPTPNHFSEPHWRFPPISSGEILQRGYLSSKSEESHSLSEHFFVTFWEHLTSVPSHLCHDATTFIETNDVDIEKKT